MGIPRDAAVDYTDIIDPDAKPAGPIHPGVILAEEFLEPLGLSAYALAQAIGVPRNRITGIETARVSIGDRLEQEVTPRAA
jgi:plasmid maintenance system antidote protein VapI